MYDVLQNHLLLYALFLNIPPVLCVEQKSRKRAPAAAAAAVVCIVATILDLFATIQRP
jgi:hypothetical protein